MISSEEREALIGLADRSGPEIARHFGCEYTGDVDPIRHGGTFYDARKWSEDGSASVVEFREGRGDNETIVARGYVYRPRGGGLLDAMRSCWGDRHEELVGDARSEIEAALSWSGIEEDSAKTYNLDTWKDWRIFRSVKTWLEALGN